MKERVTLTIDRNVLRQLDRRVDGATVKNRSHAVELCLRAALRGRVPQQALILAGGHQAKRMPKHLLMLQGKTLLEHNIELLKRFGITDIILSVGHRKEEVKERLADGSTYGVRITYQEENPDQPLGTAGPIREARKLVEGPLLVLNADELKDISLEKLYQEHIRNQGLATIALTTVKDTRKYGAALLDGNRILRFVEKPEEGDAPSRLINAGCYVLEPEVMDLIPQGFAMLEIELFPKLAREGRLYGYPFAGQWLAPETGREQWQGYTR